MATLPGMTRLALAVEYEGSDFLGWQRCSHGATVQSEVEEALSFVAGQPVTVMAAGRTDSGVHGLDQLLHFDAPVERSPRSWLLGANSRLPRSIVVTWLGPVADDFHARFSARRRRYRYEILNRSVRPGLYARFQTWERLPLAAERMHEAAQALLGEHDFTSFRALSCSARRPFRSVHDVSVRRDGERVLIEIEANAFLHHMVRNIAGSLILVGRGERPPQWLGEVLAARRRDLAGPTAPARGLIFLGPRYPAGLGLPARFEDSSLA
ncbi:MAG: tRNA pseudouridine(38-40) synthase TruA [Xanthomonadales bacterium]|nr:tRNA pseudouridine(38-40) synthase TruA [Xanthomonadales bacterium]